MSFDIGWLNLVYPYTFYVCTCCRVDREDSWVRQVTCTIGFSDTKPL